jgi:hypothetical protein
MSLRDNIEIYGHALEDCVSCNVNEESAQGIVRCRCW